MSTSSHEHGPVAPVPRVETMNRSTLIAVATEFARASGFDPAGSWSMLVDTPKGVKRVSRWVRNNNHFFTVEPS